MRTVLAAALAAAAVVAGAPAWCQIPRAAAPAAAQDERLEPALRIARVILSAADFKSLLQKAMQQAMTGSDADWMKLRPEWSGFMSDAMAEELDARQGKLELLLARPFLDGFTVGELRAGAEFMESPGVAESLRASMATDDKVPPSPAVKKALQRLAKNRDGVRFIEKFGAMNAPDAIKTDFAIAFLPGVMRRFGEKAEAAEAAREAR